MQGGIIRDAGLQKNAFVSRILSHPVQGLFHVLPDGNKENITEPKVALLCRHLLLPDVSLCF